jgi:ferredoxin-NADP reductase/MoaA/NifB/PqqE/SkfB family radical SAM enzyme
MKLRDYLFEVAPKAVFYELARRGFITPPNPLTITYSVTAACRSLCKTCNIGRVYLDNPKLAEQDLSLEEIEKVFKSLGHVYFFNVSGGEPFMRMDLAEIHRLAFLYLKPRLISIPTNSLAPRAIEKTTLKILKYMEEYLPSSVPLSVKPSIDGIGDMHDYVRGIKGNFIKLEETINRLLAIRAKNPRLLVDLGTVISNFNIHHLPEMEDWVHTRGIGAYRHEIAEQRVEFHNIGDPITPPPDVYEKLTLEFAEKIVRNIKRKAFLTRTTEAVRLAYYHVAVQILKQRRQVTPCYGGIANIHLDYNGEIWPCCILGGEKSLGNVRDWEYDVQRLLSSDQAKESKQYIADKKCACPLASQWLNNVLLTPRHMLRVLYNLFVRFPFAPAPPDPEQRSRVVHPEAIKVNITGTSSRSAIVQHQAGIIPAPEETNLPKFGGSGEQAYSGEVKSMPPPEEATFLPQVHHIQPVSSSTYVLRIDRPKVTFFPGQYVVLGKKGSYEAREYTIYSSIEDDFLEFLITKVDGGVVSNALSECAPGDVLALEGPMGYFLLDKQTRATTKYCFIATGSGIAPFHSFLRSYSDLDYTLLHGVRYASDCYDSEDYDPDRYISCISREEGGRFHGRVTDYLRQHPVDPETVCYLCGNCNMLYEVYDILVQQGIPRHYIRTEVFY